MFMNLIKIKKEYLILGIITILATFLRFYQLGITPPSLTWDEHAFGYNAWTIANYAKDEWGNLFPITFRSFNVYQQPIHIYILVPFVLLFGLNDFIVRLPFALFGVFNVLLVYFLAKQILRNNTFAFSSAFVFAISPISVHFSRIAHEANVALFFFLLGLLFFLKALGSKGKLFLLAFLFFGISLISYQSAKIIIFLVLSFIFIIYFKELLKDKVGVLKGLLVFCLFLVLHILDPQLLGLARANQTAFSDSDLEKTEGYNAVKELPLSSAYRQTESKILKRAFIVTNQYISHFSIDYLLLKGNPNPRLAIQESGEFLPLDGFFLIIGFITMIITKSKRLAIVLFWAAISPLPSSLVKESPHAARAMFMMGSFHLIIGFGIYIFLRLFKEVKIKTLAVIFIIGVYLYLTFTTYNNYFKEFNKQYAIDFQYGMKEIARFIKEHPDFNEVYITDRRSQPYIFILYNLNYPLYSYLRGVKFNTGEEKNYSLVHSFDKFIFKWDVLGSTPDWGKLYILTPSEYDGLQYKLFFDVREIVHFPNGTDAFYIVTRK